MRISITLRILVYLYLVYLVYNKPYIVNKIFNPFKDECDLELHNCHADADCINRDESFDCVCSYGYTGDGVIECWDINECLAKTHDCGPSENCINRKSGYDCICDDFSIRIEGKCVDIDECVINDPCNPATILGTTAPADLIHRRCANIEGPPGKDYRLDFGTPLNRLN